MTQLLILFLALVPIRLGMGWRGFDPAAMGDQTADRRRRSADIKEPGPGIPEGKDPVKPPSIQGP